jgi:hypothetical protein
MAQFFLPRLEHSEKCRKNFGVTAAPPRQKIRAGQGCRSAHFFIEASARIH